MKNYMCMEECQIRVEIKGKLYPKRYRFGERLRADALPNSHFCEITHDDENLPPRGILENLLDSWGVEHSPDQPDYTLQGLYSQYQDKNRKKETYDTLIKKAAEIGAKIHKAWRPERIKIAIQDREMELAEGEK